MATTLHGILGIALASLGPALLLATVTILALDLLPPLTRIHSRQSTLVPANPLVSVVLPIARVNSTHTRLLDALASQDYPCFDVVIVFEESEIVLPYSDRFHCIRNNRLGASRSNKVSNLLAALETIDARTEVVVFIDDDIDVNRGFVTSCVATALDNPGCICTSYRFVNRAYTLPDHLFLLGNNIIAAFARCARWRCVWGGCYFLSQATISRGTLQAVWENSIADDLDLTFHARREGIPIVVTREKLSAASGTFADLRSLLSWAVRQFTLARYYAHSNYIDCLVLSGVYTLSMVLSVAVVVYNPAGFLSAATMLVSAAAILVYSAAGSHVRLRSGRAVCALALAPIMIFAVALASLFGREIIWKDRKYHLLWRKEMR